MSSSIHPLRNASPLVSTHPRESTAARTAIYVPPPTVSIERKQLVEAINRKRRRIPGSCTEFSRGSKEKLTYRSKPSGKAPKGTLLPMLSMVDIYCYLLYRGIMNVHLGPAFDEFVAGLLKSGYYQTQSEVLREGLRLLKEREEIKRLRLAELRKEILLGSEQADRGEFVDGPDAFAKIRKRGAQPKKRSKAS